MTFGQLVIDPRQSEILVADLRLGNSVFCGAVAEIFPVRARSHLCEEWHHTGGDADVKQAVRWTGTRDRSHARARQEPVAGVVVGIHTDEAWRRKIAQPFVIAKEEGPILP